MDTPTVKTTTQIGYTGTDNPEYITHADLTKYKGQSYKETRTGTGIKIIKRHIRRSNFIPPDPDNGVMPKPGTELPRNKAVKKRGRSRRGIAYYLYLLIKDPGVVFFTGTFDGTMTRDEAIEYVSKKGGFFQRLKRDHPNARLISVAEPHKRDDRWHIHLVIGGLRVRLINTIPFYDPATLEKVDTGKIRELMTRNPQCRKLWSTWNRKGEQAIGKNHITATGRETTAGHHYITVCRVDTGNVENLKRLANYLAKYITKNTVAVAYKKGFTTCGKWEQWDKHTTYNRPTAGTGELNERLNRAELKYTKDKMVEMINRVEANPRNKHINEGERYIVEVYNGQEIEETKQVLSSDLITLEGYITDEVQGILPRCVALSSGDSSGTPEMIQTGSGRGEILTTPRPPDRPPDL